MCSIIIANNHYKEFPLIVAANRDEAHGRPSTGVQILSKEPHLIIGGKDKRYGGTWLGVNKESIFVAITNQGAGNPKLKSRGLVVLEALKCKTILELLTFIENVKLKEYNDFNLVFGNNKSVFLANSHLLNSIIIQELGAGVHVITSDMGFTGENIKAAFVHKKLDAAKHLAWAEYYKLLKKILANTEYGFKIKSRKNKETGKLHGHSTVSSSILAFSNEGLARYKFHDRTEERPKRKEGDPVPPRYKDYVDLWRNPDAPLMACASEEKEEHEDEDLSPKDEILNMFKNDISGNHYKIMTKLTKVYR